MFFMFKVKCSSCGFEFEVKSGKIPKKCPYCDKEGTLERKKSAQELLEEVEELEKNYVIKDKEY